MSHMAALILRANIGLNETNNNNDSEATEVACRVHASWSSADERNISVKTKWDNSRLHDEVNVIIIKLPDMDLIFFYFFASPCFVLFFSDSLVLLAMHCGSKLTSSILRWLAHWLLTTRRFNEGTSTT